jgi:hypothetical protein
MKFPLILSFILLLASCSGKNEKPNTNVTSTKNAPITARPNSLNPYSPVDLSGMDISYYPTDFPVLKMSKDTNITPIARVIYSRPHKQGRKIFGDLLKYGEPWRLGANEASEIEFFEPVRIQQQTVSKGRYILYCIPEANKWTIVFNNNIYSWGLKQDPKKDVYRFEVPTQNTTTPIENFTMVFLNTATGADLVIAWDDIEAHLPFSTL